MIAPDYCMLFSDRILTEIFPPSKADAFFEALFGDADEGAFDIALKFTQHDQDNSRLLFELHLTERPGKCLACNLTYGMPAVFARHPVIDINGVVKDIDRRIDGPAKCGGWQLGHTKTVNSTLHIIPLAIDLN